jgi:hypothetical protein
MRVCDSGLLRLDGLAGALEASALEEAVGVPADALALQAALQWPLLERTMDAPAQPFGLGVLGRAGVSGVSVRCLRRRLDATPSLVDYRVASDRVEPRRAWASVRPVG